MARTDVLARTMVDSPRSPHGRRPRSATRKRTAPSRGRPTDRASFRTTLGRRRTTDAPSPKKGTSLPQKGAVSSTHSRGQKPRRWREATARKYVGRAADSRCPIKAEGARGPPRSRPGQSKPSESIPGRCDGTHPRRRRSRGQRGSQTAPCDGRLIGRGTERGIGCDSISTPHAELRQTGGDFACCAVPVASRPLSELIGA
jgi:hypothetical protein